MNQATKQPIFCNEENTVKHFPTYSEVRNSGVEPVIINFNPVPNPLELIEEKLLYTAKYDSTSHGFWGERNPTILWTETPATESIKIVNYPFNFQAACYLAERYNGQFDDNIFLKHWADLGLKPISDEALWATIQAINKNSIDYVNIARKPSKGRILVSGGYQRTKDKELPKFSPGIHHLKIAFVNKGGGPTEEILLFEYLV